MTFGRSIDKSQVQDAEFWEEDAAKEPADPKAEPVVVQVAERTLEDKARDGYGRVRSTTHVGKALNKLPWEKLSQANRVSWIAKASRVEREPEEWVYHSDPGVVAFAKGVLGLI